MDELNGIAGKTVASVDATGFFSHGGRADAEELIVTFTDGTKMTVYASPTNDSSAVVGWAVTPVMSKE